MQYARPSSDITVSGWTASSGSAYSCLDEASYNDSDFVQNLSAGTNSLEVGLSSVVDPASAAGHTLRYRFQLDFEGLLEDEPESSIRFSLIQGTTVIATETRTFPYNSAATSYTLTLSAGEANSITDYSDLRFRAEVLVGWTGAFYKVTWAEFEVPDSASGSNAYIAADSPAGVVVRTYDYPFSHVLGKPREGRWEIFSPGEDSQIRGAKPRNKQDAKGGRICTFLGVWYPGSQIVYVDGQPYYRGVAPKPQRPMPKSISKFMK